MVKVLIKVTRYRRGFHTWYGWLLKRAGPGGRPIARNIEPFTDANIANKSANRMGDLFRELKCEVEVIHAAYVMAPRKPRPPRPVKVNCDDMVKYGVKVV